MALTLLDRTINETCEQVARRRRLVASGELATLSTDEIAALLEVQDATLEFMVSLLALSVEAPEVFAAATVGSFRDPESLYAQQRAKMEKKALLRVVEGGAPESPTA